MARMVRFSQRKLVDTGLTSLTTRFGHGFDLVPRGTIPYIPIVLSALLSHPAFAATINTEAASPQRTHTPVARVLTAPPRSHVPIASPARAGAVNGAGVRESEKKPPHKVTRQARTLTTPPSLQHEPIRQVIVPVLGREHAAARAILPDRQPVERPQEAVTTAQTALTATTLVRASDVAEFQKIGAPYQIKGTWYVPAHEPDYNDMGTASWYGSDFHGRSTANGELFDMNVVSGAHPTLPIPSLVEVTNFANGRSLVVRINDRGPFVGNRLIDLSARGAELLGFRDQGQAQVRVRYIGPANSEPIVTAQNISAVRMIAGVRPAILKPQKSRDQVQVQAQVLGIDANTYIQVGAFTRRANADRLADQATNLGLTQVIETAQANGDILYRVVLGPSSRTEAQTKIQEMSTHGFSGARLLAALD